MKNFFVKKFSRRKEDFQCLHCGKTIAGDGYTNHCPHCFWSQHVDIQPGDRAALCRGAMRPVGVFSQKGAYRIQHRCEKCGFERPNKMQKNDDFAAFLTLARRLAGA